MNRILHFSLVWILLSQVLMGASGNATLSKLGNVDNQASSWTSQDQHSNHLLWWLSLDTLLELTEETSEENEQDNRSEPSSFCGPLIILSSVEHHLRPSFHFWQTFSDSGTPKYTLYCCWRHFVA